MDPGAVALLLAGSPHARTMCPSQHCGCNMVAPTAIVALDKKVVKLSSGAQMRSYL